MPLARPALHQWLPPLLVGASGLLLWQLYVVVFSISPLLLPTPLQIAGFIVEHPLVFARNMGSTLGAILLGYLVGSLTGLLLGCCMTLSRRVHSGLYPWMVASQMVPIAAIAPILVLWFGFSLLPKVIVVAMICFFPVAVNTVDGLRSVDPEMVRLMRAFGANNRKILWSVSLPTALPSVFSGLRVAIALGVVAAVFGEWVGSNSGLGYLMLSYNNRLNTVGLFASVVVLSVMGIVLFFAVGFVEQRVIPWKSDNRRKREH